MSALRKVLVVDDDPVVAKSFNRVLTDKGYLVVTAQNAQQALERMRGEDVDLVYTDIRMPGMDGLELAEKVKARRPWTPVVIVTGYGTTANEERARAAGVSAFLHKPLSPQMIEDSAFVALQQAHGAVAEPAMAKAEVQPEIQAEVQAEEGRSRIKDVALFAAAPFIGLVYAVFLPFVGMAMLGWSAAKALAGTGWMKKHGATLRYMGTAAAAPFIGLAYAVLLPLAGLGMLAWVGWQALVTPRPTH